MANYRSLKSFRDDENINEFISTSSPGQLLFNYNELASQIHLYDKNEHYSILFFEERTTANFLDNDEIKADLNDALHYYRSQGEPLRTINDLLKAMAFRIESLDDHVGKNHSLDTYRDIIKFTAKYYVDPLEAINVLFINCKINTTKLFNEFPPTRSSHTILQSENYNGYVMPFYDHQEGFTDFNSSVDLDELWKKNIKIRTKKDIESSSEGSHIYKKARSNGDEASIREQMQMGNRYALNDHFYNTFWDKEGYLELEKTLADNKMISFEVPGVIVGNINPVNDTILKMRMHSSMAKIASEIVPFVLEMTDYDSDMASLYMANYLGQLANSASKNLEKIMLLNQESWGMKGNDMRKSNKGSSPTNDEASRIYYEALIKEFSPLHYKASLKESLQKNKLSEKDEFIKELNKSVDSFKSKLEILSKENRSLKGRINFTPEEAILSTRRSNAIVRDEVASIAYAACADHLRQKLELHGEDVSYLDKFPNIEETIKKLNEKRDIAIDSVNKAIVSEGKPDPSIVGISPQDRGPNEEKLINLMLGKISSQHAINTVEMLKKEFVPEIDQLRNAKPDADHSIKPSGDESLALNAAEDAKEKKNNVVDFLPSR